MTNARKSVEGPRDRLSHLPDFIIHHILSFIDTKSAVRTSVLSRGWRHSWKHVPVLDLHSDSFEDYETFQMYVDEVLFLRYPLSVRKMTFVSKREDYDDSEPELDDGQFARVIGYALRHDVQHLSFYLEHCLYPDNYFRFSNVFGSSSSTRIRNCNLRTLELGYFTLHSGFLSFGFGSLTALKLESCYLCFNWEDGDTDPLSNFPCLQNLVMKHISTDLSCRDMYETCFKVSGLQLLSLTLENVGFFKVEVYAPKLKSFCFWEDEAEEEYVEVLELNLPSLDHADVFVVHEEQVDQYLIRLFQDLHNVKSLKLHSETIKVLNGFDELFEQQASPFTRLKHLKLQSNKINDRVLNYFFKASGAKPIIEFV